VIRIVDGDTYSVIFEGKKEKIRLIGIDTPESRSNKKAKKDADLSNNNVEDIVKLGKLATEFVKSILKPKDTLRLEFDLRERDQYGRLLVYAYFANGEMLNEVIVKNGYASPLTYPPNVKYAKVFSAAFQYAREKKLGLWSK